MPAVDKEYNGQKEECKRIESVLEILAQDIEVEQETGRKLSLPSICRVIYLARNRANLNLSIQKAVAHFSMDSIALLAPALFHGSEP